MGILLILILVVLVATVLGRWTRLHPLVIAGMTAVLPGALAMLVMAGMFADGSAMMFAGLAAYGIAGGVAGFGAFMGWLRRRHVERIGS